MKTNTRYPALIGGFICAVLLATHSVADPGHGHANGHSQTDGMSAGGTSGGGMSGGGSSGAQLFLGDGMAVPTYKNSSDFFTAGSADKGQGRANNFVPPSARDSAVQKSGSSDLLSPTNAGSNTSSVASSATTTSKSNNNVAAGSAVQKPDWLVNASSGSGPKPKPEPSASPAPKPSPSVAPVLVPKQVSIDPPPPI